MRQLKLQMEQFEVKIKKKKLQNVSNSKFNSRKQPKCYENLLNKCRKPHIYRGLH